MLFQSSPVSIVAQIVENVNLRIIILRVATARTTKNVFSIATTHVAMDAYKHSGIN